MSREIHSDEAEEAERARARNEDPLSGAPGAHPLATGAGALLGGVAGAALGAAVAGPVGGVAGLGLATGALAGGLIGKAAGEAVDPTFEDAYWREHHSTQAHGISASYEDYEPAYRAGYEAYGRFSDRKYEDVEDDIRAHYQSHRAGLPWDKAQHAVRAAWDRAHEHRVIREGIEGK